MRAVVLLACIALVMPTTGALAAEASYICRLVVDAYTPGKIKDPNSEIGNSSEMLFSLRQNAEGVVVGTYKNVNGGWMGHVIGTSNQKRVTLLENSLADNGFVLSIFLHDKNENGFQAVMHSHSTVYGIEQRRGYCR